MASKWKRKGMGRARREDQDAELQRVLDDLEAEHGGVPHAHMLARHHVCSDETALRDERDRAEVARAEATHRDRLLASSLDARVGQGLEARPKISKRALGSGASDVPSGYAHDDATGFLFCAATGWYLERTPTRELHCHQAVGVWCYWDSLASEWRPYPADLLTPSEQAVASVALAAAAVASVASAVAVPTPVPLATVPMTAAEAAAAAAAAAAAEAAAVATAAAAAAAEAEAACVPHRAAPPLCLPDLTRRTAVSFSSISSAPLRKPKRRHERRPLVAAAQRAADGGEGEEADAQATTSAPTSAPPSTPSLSIGPGTAAAAAVPAVVSVPALPALTGPAEVHAAAAGAAAAGAAVVDLSQRVCLLCQRQFNSAETLLRHVAFSRLHADNLAQQQQQQLQHQQQPG